MLIFSPHRCQRPVVVASSTTRSKRIAILIASLTFAMSRRVHIHLRVLALGGVTFVKVSSWIAQTPAMCNITYFANAYSKSRLKVSSQALSGARHLKDIPNIAAIPPWPTVKISVWLRPLHARSKDPDLTKRNVNGRLSLICCECIRTVER